MKHRSSRRTAAVLSAVLALTAAGCSLEDSAPATGTVRLVVGYQSKTINTVTAGTLLRAKGFLERRLSELTARGGPKYEVQWQDYDTGAPITAQMVAEKIDIGSMGDYPLLINGSRTRSNPRAETELVSVTGYHPRGALNMVVVPPNSGVHSLPDLAGRKISASVGSAGHGTLVQALRRAGIDPKTGVEVLNQQPQIGASALESGQVAALSQFVAWPGLLVFQNKAALLYDGAELNVPTFHGVVARRDYARQHPEVLETFLQAQLDATEYLNTKPLDAARVVAENAGLPAEVVYLYNGPGGTTFDTTLKARLVDTLKSDVQYLKSIGDFADLDVSGFVDDTALRKVYAARGQASYEAVQANFGDASAFGGELWLDGKEPTQLFADPAALLSAVKQARAQGSRVRAAYIADAELHTRWFADKALWIRDGAAYLPFTTAAAAQRYLAGHPGGGPVSYDDAVNGARQ